MEKQYFSQNDYDRVIAAAKEKYDYDNMSDSQKEDFDKILDENYGVKDEGSDSSDGIRSDSGQTEKKYLNQNDYDKVVASARERNNYDSMSDSQKEDFDKLLDERVGVKEDEDADSSDGMHSDSEKMRDFYRKQYGYENMSDDQREDFDKKYDNWLEQQKGEFKAPEQAEETEEAENVRRRTR